LLRREAAPHRSDDHEIPSRRWAWRQHNRWRSLKMLRWALIFFAISVVAAVLQFTQFTQFAGVPVGAVEFSMLLSLAFLISFIAFLVFGLFALAGPESDSDKHLIARSIKALFGWR
jgi:uncharacterized membrane protein YtjA (UPF0391 family)